MKEYVKGIVAVLVLILVSWWLIVCVGWLVAAGIEAFELGYDTARDTFS